VIHSTWSVLKREFAGYFATPLAYVFIVIFLLATGVFTFYIGDFFARGQADLKSFFSFHPWLYLFLIPAISMRLWAEERRSGTIELLVTLPVPLASAVLGKFLAAWLFTAIALALTFPIWITVNVLGSPDNGVILAGYIGSLFMSGAYLAIGACISATTKNQVVAFVVSVAVCFLFLVSGLPIVLDLFRSWAPPFFTDVLASFSFLTQFNGIVDGVISAKSAIFFASLIAFWLVLNGLIVELKKAR
jgi:gliding motility-associated transport system permease protein